MRYHNGRCASPQTGRLAELDPLQPVRNVLCVGGQQAAQPRGPGFATIQQRCLVCRRHVQLQACSGSSIPTVADDLIMQYIYTMNGVSKVVPPKRQIIKDISLSFFPAQRSACLA
jgi:hypothetical protein